MNCSLVKKVVGVKLEFMELFEYFEESLILRLQNIDIDLIYFHADSVYRLGG